ncbi:MAG TPA: hypothetical protein DCG10_00385 [Lachnospiraceae bacterium]|jgi:hypothetical protein|nr:hypothetical protein [Lachnospiraceae bacterium]
MPTKAYGKFLKNLETVNRLDQTYDEVRISRNKKGKAAYDHITRSAIIFLASAFEVYIEDVTKECCSQHIALAGEARRLPHDVKSTINKHIREKNIASPTDLCDAGWKEVYRTLVNKETERLNTPKQKQITDLFGTMIGIRSTDICNLQGIDKLDEVITFRGAIAHRVKTNEYVKIERVRADVDTIKKLVVEIDKMILDYFKNCYPEVRVPWNNTY